jgi:hypothetical protein
MHLRPAFPQISRAPRGLMVGEGPLAAASPQTPWLGGNRLRASLGDLLVIRRAPVVVLRPDRPKIKQSSRHRRLCCRRRLLQRMVFLAMVRVLSSKIDLSDARTRPGIPRCASISQGLTESLSLSADSQCLYRRRQWISEEYRIHFL